MNPLVRVWLRSALLPGVLLLGTLVAGRADAASVTLRPEGAELTRAVQDALLALSSPDFAVTLDTAGGVVLTLGGAAPFNPDVSARVVTVGGERRIEFNPRGPLPLNEAVRAELTRELGLKDWTGASARLRLSGADLNGDGRIDLSDLAILMNNYGKAGTVGDLNQDRKVDDTDLKLFSAQYRP